METLLFIGYKFTYITIELTILFLVISGVIGLALQYITEDKLRRWLSFRGITGNFLGAALGAVTPFCACSTIPLTAGFLKAGVPFGSTISFVIASPILNPYIVGMMSVLLGVKAAAVYFSVAFLAAIGVGSTLDRFGYAQHVKNVRITGQSQAKQIGATFWEKSRIAGLSAWKDYLKVLPYILIGISIGATIYGVVPGNFLVRVAGPQNPLAVPVAALIGVPLYIRASAALAIVAPLIEKGVSVGTAMALVVGGAGMAIPEMTLLAALFKKRLVATLVIVVYITAVASGLLFNLLAQ